MFRHKKRREVKPNLLAKVAMMTGQMDYRSTPALRQLVR
jgi:hypothetical protein